MATLESLYPHIPRLDLSGVSSHNITSETYVDRIRAAVRRAIANLCISLLKWLGYPLLEEIASLRKHISQIPPRTIEPDNLLNDLQIKTRSLELDVASLTDNIGLLELDKKDLQKELESEKRRSQSLVEQNEELQEVREQLEEAKKLLAAGNPFTTSSVVK